MTRDTVPDVLRQGIEVKEPSPNLFNPSFLNDHKGFPSQRFCIIIVTRAKPSACPVEVRIPNGGVPALRKGRQTEEPKLALCW